MRRLAGPWRVLPAAVVLTWAAACGDSSFGAPDPKSEEGESIFSLWRGTFLAAIAVGLIVWGLLIYVLVRYRRRNDEVPDQTAYHIPVEVVYTVIPIVIVAGLFAFSWITEDEVTSLDSDPATTIEVLGFQWSWQFHYRAEGVTVTGEPGEPPEMVLPVDQTARLRLVANDVAHSFWVPDFLSKRDLIPGVDNEIDVTPTQKGTFVGRCAEFCGLDHWQMTFSVRVVDAEEFRSWLDDRPSDSS